ncbi:hypothetical protein OEIGOIKO_03370 [Streptomyces chrestomyceticus JCM 4735]|uniref:Uncharacterized protein n=1 Tax=Streptomyces chrestomyceticus JCM 4735 TaxID=1306181 RepID=A0A7U9KUH8_9ACTN|nr:hypothetical protein [Streptomyces chrestomyceticus]GCD35624.1 hypothetical protein OEIGOIKO_03370 [Streptomyces chrestomyceticus JCM 4735]
MMTYPSQGLPLPAPRLLLALLLLLIALCILILMGSYSPEQLGQFLGALIAALLPSAVTARIRLS